MTKIMTNTYLAWVSRCYGGMIHQRDHAPYHYAHIWDWVGYQNKLAAKLRK